VECARWSGQFHAAVLTLTDIRPRLAENNLLAPSRRTVGLKRAAAGGNRDLIEISIWSISAKRVF